MLFEESLERLLEAREKFDAKQFENNIIVLISSLKNKTNYKKQLDKNYTVLANKGDIKSSSMEMKKRVVSACVHLIEEIKIPLPIDSEKSMWGDRELKPPKPIYGSPTAKPDMVLVSQKQSTYFPISVKTGDSWVAVSAQNPEEFEGIMNFGLKMSEKEISPTIVKIFNKHVQKYKKEVIGKIIERSNKVDLSEVFTKAEKKGIGIEQETRERIEKIIDELNSELDASRRNVFKKASSDFSKFLNENLYLKQCVLFEALSAYNKFDHKDPYYAQYMLSEKYAEKLEGPNTKKIQELVSNPKNVKMRFGGLAKQRSGRTIKLKKILKDIETKNHQELKDELEKAFFKDMISMLKVDVSESVAYKDLKRNSKLLHEELRTLRGELLNEDLDLQSMISWVRKTKEKAWKNIKTIIEKIVFAWKKVWEFIEETLQDIFARIVSLFESIPNKVLFVTSYFFDEASLGGSLFGEEISFEI